MSNYRNFIKDFPTRCVRLLDFHSEAAEVNLEITLLIAVAGQTIIMPMERLKPKHPSGDAKTFEHAESKLNEVLNTQCKNSPLFRGEDGRFDPDAWKFKLCDMEEVKAERVTPLVSIGNEQCEMVVTLLRNALAHGNLRTDGSPIDRLVFISCVDVRKPHKGFRRLECDPDTLRCFLAAWVTELKNLDLKTGEIVESLSFVAI